MSFDVTTLALAKSYADQHGGATDEQVATAVNTWLTEHPEATTTVQDGAITGSKIADNAISSEKLTDYNIVDNRVDWVMFIDGYNTKTNMLYQDSNSAIYELHLEAGKTYKMEDPVYLGYGVVPNPPSYEDNGYSGYYMAYNNSQDASTVLSKRGFSSYIITGIINTIISTLNIKGIITLGNTEDITGNGCGSYFTVNEDVYLYRASIKPTDDTPIISNVMAFEQESGFIGYGGDVHNSQSSSIVYKFDLGSGFKNYPFYLKSILASPTAKADCNREYLAMSRDVPRDRSLYIQFIGDSITYAASNAGLQNAFRKYVPMSLNAPSNTLCQSGVSVTTNSGSFDWNGKSNTSDDYNADMSGYLGLATKIPEISDTTYLSTKNWRDGVDIVIVALGTNDFWEGATLGDISTLEDDTTFYGAVEKTIKLIEERYKNAQILWVLPFKNSKWSTANSAGKKLTDYLIALKILCQTHERVWTLDLFDKWFLDYDNESIRSTFFIDQVHITANAHKCVAESMVDKIRQIISVCGLRRIESITYNAGGDNGNFRGE